MAISERLATRSFFGMGRGEREESGMIGVAFLREGGASRQCGVGNRGPLLVDLEKETGGGPAPRVGYPRFDHLFLLQSSDR
jgi:hypothetical protein